MNDFSKLMSDMMRQSQDFAEQWAKGVQSFREAMPPEMREAWEKMMPPGAAGMLEEMAGPGLNPKLRALATVAGLTAKGGGDAAALTAAIDGALSAGASRRDVSETILQMATIGAFDGVPKAMTIAMQVMAARGSNT